MNVKSLGAGSDDGARTSSSGGIGSRGTRRRCERRCAGSALRADGYCIRRDKSGILGDDRNGWSSSDLGRCCHWAARHGCVDDLSGYHILG